MPKITTLRHDIMRRPEIDAMVERAKPKSVERALVCFLWLFGKRITETITVQQGDAWVDGGYFYAKFYVLKKRSREQGGIRKLYLKRIRADHPYVKYILEYLKRLESNPSNAIFPFSRFAAYYRIKKLNPKTYPHFFRDSLATTMAENGASPYELMFWFDWDRIETSMKYIKYGTKLVEKWSDRNF